MHSGLLPCVSRRRWESHLALRTSSWETVAVFQRFSLKASPSPWGQNLAEFMAVRNVLILSTAEVKSELIEQIRKTITWQRDNLTLTESSLYNSLWVLKWSLSSLCLSGAAKHDNHVICFLCCCLKTCFSFKLAIALDLDPDKTHYLCWPSRPPSHFPPLLRKTFHTRLRYDLFCQNLRVEPLCNPLRHSAPLFFEKLAWINKVILICIYFSVSSSTPYNEKKMIMKLQVITLLLQASTHLKRI